MAERQTLKVPSLLEGKRIFKGDKPLAMIFLCLIVCSILVFYSATPKMGYGAQAITRAHSHLLSHLMSISLGFTTALIAYLLPFKFVNRCSRGMFYFFLVLTLITPLIGVTINGATRWISVFGFSLQPSEFLRISTIVYTAYLLSRYRDYVERWSILVFFRWLQKKNVNKQKEATDILKHGLWQISIVFFAILIILLEHTSSAVLLGLSIFIMLLVGGISRSEVRRLLLIGACLIALMMVFHNIGRSKTAKGRVKDWIELWTKGYDKSKPVYEFADAELSMVAIYNGGLYGNGAGQSVMRAKMTHPESDYIFGIFFEEYGLMLAIPLILTYLWIFARCFIIAARSKWVYKQLCVTGLGFMMVAQAMIHFMVAVNLLPETGQTLPLISHGGSSIICYSFAIGYILNASKQQEL